MGANGDAGCGARGRQTVALAAVALLAVTAAPLALAGTDVTVYQQDFESGLGDFVLDNGQGADGGLWYLSLDCESLEEDTKHSTETALRYGLPTICDSYSAGSTAGLAISPPISLESDEDSYALSVKYFLETEKQDGFDWASVEVAQNTPALKVADFRVPAASRDDDTFDWNTVEVAKNTSPLTVLACNDASTGCPPLVDGAGTWQTLMVDLTPFRNADIQLYFVFRTNDATNNNYAGFYVDDVHVTRHVNNDRPVAANVLIDPPNPNVGNTLTATYDYSDPEGADEVLPAVIRWYRDTIPVPEFNDETTIPPFTGHRGEKWYFTIQVNDGTVLSEVTVSQEVTFTNQRPTVSNPVITPATPNSADPLTASYDYSDPEGAPESGSLLRWYRDGVLVSTYTNWPTVPFSSTAEGQVWYFTVLVSDGDTFSDLATSPSVTITNAIPSITYVDLLPVEVTVEGTLTVTYDYTDADGDPEMGTQIRWYKNGALQSTFNDLVSIDIADTSPATGDEWYAEVSVSDDGARYAPAGTTEISMVVEEPLSIQVVGPLEVEADPGDTVTFTAEARGGITSVYTYQWFVKYTGDTGPAVAIADANDPVLTLDDIVVADGGVYTCQVTDGLAVVETDPGILLITVKMPVVGLWGLVLLTVAVAFAAARMLLKRH